MSGGWKNIWTLFSRPGERIEVVEAGYDVIDDREEFRLRIEKSLSQLRGQIERLNNKYRELAARNKLYFEKCIEALVAKDEERAKIYASEIAEIKKLAKIIVHSQLVLLQIRIRLESILELGEVLVLVRPLITLLENVRTEIADVVPEASENLRSLANTIENFITESETYVEPPPSQALEELSDEANFILNEARRIAAEKVKEHFPDIPTLTEEEKAVYSYVMSNQNEELDLGECASQLGISPENLQEILRRLQEKGLIEIQIGEVS